MAKNNKVNKQKNDKKSAKGKKSSKAVKAFCIGIPLALIVALGVALPVNAKSVIKTPPLGERTLEQEKKLSSVLDTLYPERKSVGLTPLPKEYFGLDEYEIEARSAIIVDVKTGSIIWEKNADEQIPPASMTKIVEMYVVLEAVKNGTISLDDVVPLPPESWEVNLPSDASRMHLAKGQVVTLRELLLGLAIASGNDASIAVANYVAGNMEDFVSRMNGAVKRFGLEKTHFVESSGYSEKNLTTAREFALFARQYILDFPDALKEFHAKPSLRYPTRKNMPDGSTPVSYTQNNTNKLLSKIQGCDGLKTGFIYESGYNISVTAEMNGTRFLSVTMGGPGNNTVEGNSFRVSDNMTLFNYAFSHYADYHAPTEENKHEFTVGIFGGAEKSVKLVPAFDETFTVPKITSDSPTGAAASVYVRADVPRYLYGKIECGKQYGTITYMIDDEVLRVLPLVADRDVELGGFFNRTLGKLDEILLDAIIKN